MFGGRIRDAWRRLFQTPIAPRSVASTSLAVIERLAFGVGLFFIGRLLTHAFSDGTGFQHAFAQTTGEFARPLANLYGMAVLWLSTVRGVAKRVNIETPELFHLPLVSAALTAFIAWPAMSVIELQHVEPLPDFGHAFLCFLSILKMMLIGGPPTTYQSATDALQRGEPGVALAPGEVPTRRANLPRVVLAVRHCAPVFVLRIQHVVEGNR